MLMNCTLDSLMESRIQARRHSGEADAIAKAVAVSHQRIEKAFSANDRKVRTRLKVG